VVDDLSEEEWRVEEICNNKELNNSVLEFFIRWKGRDGTKERFKNVTQIKALNKYKHFYSLVALNSI